MLWILGYIWIAIMVYMGILRFDKESTVDFAMPLAVFWPLAAVALPVALLIKLLEYVGEKIIAYRKDAIDTQEKL